MKIEHNQFAQVVSLSESDFINPSHYEYFKMIGVGCNPKTTIGTIRSLLLKPEALVPDKHFVFTVDAMWEQFSPTAQKAFLDHEYGHIAAGHLDGAAMQQGGAVLIEQWEFEADDFSVKFNGREIVLNALLEVLPIFNKQPHYACYGIDLMKDPTLQKRLARLGYRQ